MADIEFLQPLIPYCLYHHERYDGKGYPYGKEGEDIPIEGRVVAVADTFDAITSNRPYREGRPPEVGLKIIKENKGSQFDPECVDAFIRAFEKGNIQRVMQDYFKESGDSVVCAFCSTHVRLPEGTEVGDVLSCEVCHRKMLLAKMNEALYAERVPETQ